MHLLHTANRDVGIDIRENCKSIWVPQQNASDYY